MRVVIREAAYDDLDRIYAWIAKDRPRSADSVIDRILESIGQLGRFQYLGHAGRAAGTHEWVVTGLLYIVVYEVDSDNDELRVVAIFHGAQNRE
jgi:toxin ParE1/3/4